MTIQHNFCCGPVKQNATGWLVDKDQTFSMVENLVTHMILYPDVKGYVFAKTLLNGKKKQEQEPTEVWGLFIAQQYSYCQF